MACSSQNSTSPAVLVGLDIGGTGTRAVAMTSQGEVIARRRTRTPGDADRRDPVQFLIDQIRLVTRGTQPAGIGIGTSGPIDASGIVRNPDTLPLFTGVPLVQPLAAEFGAPVHIDNDAVCAAVGEYRVGAGQGAVSLLQITLGTGIGVVLLDHGTPVRGGDGQHPESGHIAVPGANDPCYCGRTSCWEQIASRGALQRCAARLLNLDPGDRDALPRLARLAMRGEGCAERIFLDYGEAVANGLSTLLTIYRPTLVVLSGSAAIYLPLFHEAIDAILAPLGNWIAHPPIQATALDDYAGAIGAAHLILNQAGIGATSS